VQSTLFLVFGILSRQSRRLLSVEEVARLIEAAGNLHARTILMALYSAGMRRSSDGRPL
jgi:hypothetical protein